MSNMKTTDWFDGAKFVPYYVGVYETIHQFCSETTYQYWNGKFWGFFGPKEELEEKYQHQRSAAESPQWRGIKK